MADVALKEDLDDSTTVGCRISHLEQADEIVIYSTIMEDPEETRPLV